MSLKLLFYPEITHIVANLTFAANLKLKDACYAVF